MLFLPLLFGPETLERLLRGVLLLTGAYVVLLILLFCAFAVLLVVADLVMAYQAQRDRDGRS